MTNENEKNRLTPSSTPARRAGTSPALEELPRLTELVLTSAVPGQGIIDRGSGSTVF